MKIVITILVVVAIVYIVVIGLRRRASERPNEEPEKETWIRASQHPRVPFPFPKGARLRAREEVIMGFPAGVFREDEAIGSMLHCDDDAELAYAPGEEDIMYLKLKPGMTFSMGKSCELVILADDDRPRSFEVMKPRTNITEPLAPAEPAAGDA